LTIHINADTNIQIILNSYPATSVNQHGKISAKVSEAVETPTHIRWMLSLSKRRPTEEVPGWVARFPRGTETSAETANLRGL
jgi:hypothetical protein